MKDCDEFNNFGPEEMHWSDHLYFTGMAFWESIAAVIGKLLAWVVSLRFLKYRR